MKIHRLSEVRDENDVLTHKMCCICFEFVPVADVWRDSEGQRWDICSDECAADAGMS